MILAEVLEAHRPYGLDCKCGEPINSDAGWAAHVRDVLRELLTVRSVEELDALPAEAIIKTEGGSVACRFYDGIHGVVFGDDRPFVWSRLETELPGVILWHPDWGTP